MQTKKPVCTYAVPGFVEVSGLDGQLGDGRAAGADGAGEEDRFMRPLRIPPSAEGSTNLVVLTLSIGLHGRRASEFGLEFVFGLEVRG
ncbi:MAG: hypothetical protein UX09_C0035G0011 [Candidatus Uhrbacteria bacterium GW2011_GWE2_45_35]|uniref:Uncharacterized protein n=2 Tax=Candidatus Uhriibacteriota TaxID=1752732 RepID=A0A0G1JF91_9BACT|nr:MAG: hypothetical protein UW63_C0029G0010 [Candidatus Uhrbacteria bacterium GW2011_GWF2_44_350]KKU07080.1 MAG: hypothetical protein UX09_C0035G0011 [Candidatus Uhrbacteria bacterium GW2011_GWE2_45_35]